MAQLLVDRVRTVVPTTRRPVSIDLREASPTHDAVSTVEFRPESESALVLAAARADVVRLSFSAAVPTPGAMSRVVALLEEEIATVGRARSEVRILLDVEVVLAVDEAAARRKRSHLDSLDSLAGLTWTPAASRVVAAAPQVVREVLALAAFTGVDGLVLVPLAGSAQEEQRLRSLIRSVVG